MSRPAQRPAARERQLQRFRDLVQERTGIRMPASKTLMIEARLRKRLIALGLADLDGYLQHLFEGGALQEELPEIVDAMTTNTTDFFREPAHFDMLARRIVPAALSSAGPGRRRPLRFWSAAASTGAEAWSAAMLLARAAEADPRLDWAILGTDISRRVLAAARRAIYPVTDFEAVPKDLRDAYVMTGRRPDLRETGRIVPELRARVHFAHRNLLDAPYHGLSALDVIFLRNVLIYFDAALQARVVAACAATLRAGGHLVVGHSESMTVRHPGLSQVSPGVFQLKEAA